jgi:glycosyltransferase involved in cell wall biosynthesis
LRIAWIGPGPRLDGGVPGVAALIVGGLADAGVEVDCFCAERFEEIPLALRSLDGVRWILQRPAWRWDAWYSSAAATAFFTRQAATAIARARLGRSIVERHERRRYDVVYQFSSVELLELRRQRTASPPILLHPQVHAAGERDALRTEASWADQLQPTFKTALVRRSFDLRAVVQARDIRVPEVIVCPSRAFARALARDYGVPAHRLRCVPNPVDLQHFAPVAAPRPPGPVELRFASYLAVRKGCELIAALSRRLADLAGQVRITVAGQGRMWSDYTGLMRDLDPSIGQYVGWVPHERLPQWYRGADAVLVPSHYEPFAMTLAEALACGTPVVASDAVGAAEWVRSSACRTFPSGDLGALEREVRSLIVRLREGAGTLRQPAREAAERQFSPDRIIPRVVSALEQAAGARRA